MKILIINGSPKKEKSDTMHLTNAFVDGMNSINKNEVTLIHAVEQEIKPCTGCFTCKKNGGNCIHNDAMKKILNLILHTDIIIWSFPLYCFSMPAPLKAILDRTMPLSSMNITEIDGVYQHKGQFDYSKLKYVMISGCGFPSVQNNFEAVVKQFTMMFGEEDSTIITITESPLFNISPVKLFTKPLLKKMKQAGREYAEYRKITSETMIKLSKPMIAPKLYEKLANSN